MKLYFYSDPSYIAKRGNSKASIRNARNTLLFTDVSAYVTNNHLIVSI